MIVLEYFRNMITNPTPAAFFPTFIVLFLLLFFIYYIKAVKPRQGTTEWITQKMNRSGLTFISERYPMEQRDLAPLLIIVILFLFLGLFNLGDFTTVNVTAEIKDPTPGRTHTGNLYFDEVHHVRTAVEHIENIAPYEISHPPLGKEIISASILLFGMSPFGWRFLGAVCGVIMIIVMYIFIKNMFGRTIIAASGALLLGFDFMRFIQSRIATLDTFSVLFILLSFFFMYRLITTDPDAPFRKSLVSLALSGIFFGLSVAVKWTGFYAGAGLLIIYIIRLFQLGFYYKSTKTPGFGIYLAKTLLFSMLFFVYIPAVVYYVSYIPYGIARGMSISGGMLWSADYFNLVWGNQIFMFNYHSKLVAEHSFSSMWYHWIFNVRPILYVHRTVGDTRAVFGAFGNPVIIWGGLIAMIIMAVRVFSHRDGKALLILIGYLSQLLPWVAVSRIVFAYHYFPSILFLVLALAHIFNTYVENRGSSGTVPVCSFVAVTGAVFAVFYPSMSGLYMPGWYFSALIKWFPSWPF